MKAEIEQYQLKHFFIIIFVFYEVMLKSLWPNQEENNLEP